MEAKLLEELDAAGLLVTADRPHPRPMEYADLGRLTYLSWVCKARAPVPALPSSRHPALLFLVWQTLCHGCGLLAAMPSLELGYGTHTGGPWSTPTKGASPTCPGSARRAYQWLPYQ